MTKLVKQPTAPFNPFYGCAIMFMVVAMGLGGLFWIYHVGKTMDEAIGQFTVDHPVKPVAVKPDAAGVAALKSRVDAFAAEAKAGNPATLALSIPELNALVELAPDTGYGNFADILAFQAATPGGPLTAEVCLPMNKNPLVGGKRYAIGQAMFQVEIVNETGPDLKLTALEVPGKEVLPEFVQLFSSYSLLAPYHKLETLAPVMKAIKAVKITDTGVELSTQP
jgi:hypothetical protein